MDHGDYIQFDSDIMLGKPVVKGTRITVELILKKLSEGVSHADLISQYPSLTPNVLNAVLAYAADVVSQITATCSNKLNNDLSIRYSQFNGDDTVFHYSKLHTALENILPSGNLKFSQRRASRDFQEKWIPPVVAREDSHQMLRIAKNMKQLCFCKNSSINPTQFGYLKPRMWEQYAEDYSGVCLAFSKHKLIEKASHHGDIVYDHIYHSATNFDVIEESDNIDQIVSKNLRKHPDYSGENEFRLLSFSDSEEEYIDIYGSLIGIIVPSKYRNEPCISNKLREYETKYQYKTTFIDWNSFAVHLFPF